MYFAEAICSINNFTTIFAFESCLEGRDAVKSFPRRICHYCLRMLEKVGLLAILAFNWNTRLVIL